MSAQKPPASLAVATAGGNGHDDDERDEAAKAHAAFERIPPSDALRAAYVSGHLAKWGMHRHGSVVVDMDAKLGRVAVEVSSLARSNARLVNLAEARITALDAKLDDRCDRIEKSIAQRFTLGPDTSARLPSITDEAEDEDTRVRQAKERVRAMDAVVIADIRAELAQNRQEKHDAEVRAKALADKKAEDDAAAEKREERLKRRIAILIGVGAIVSGIATTAAYTYGRLELRPAQGTQAPTK